MTAAQESTHRSSDGRKWRIVTIQVPRGWYARAYNDRGIERYTGPMVSPTPREAKQDAINWIEANDLQPMTEDDELAEMVAGTD